MATLTSHNDPFYKGSTPDLSGKCALDGDNDELYYEVRGRRNEQKLVIIVGAFGTCQQLHYMSDRLCNFFEVLIYDHRGVGQSTHKKPIRSTFTSMMLARDAMAVMNKVWSSDQRAHVMGISMGGMVGQKLGFLLAKRQRLASLTLAVTSRSYTPVPSPVSFWFLRKFLFNLLVDSDPVQQVNNMVKDAMPEEILEGPFVGPHHEGVPMREVLREGWLQRFEELFVFHRPDVCVAEVGVVMGHKLSDSEAELLRESRAPITVVAADDDRLIKTEGQHRLAQLLDAQLVRVRGGHLMAYPADFEALMGAVTGQIDRASRAGVAA